MANKITTVVSDYHNDKVREFVRLKNTSLSRIIAGIIDNELSKPNPFDFDYTLPDTDTYDKFAYSHQGSKIINFLNKSPKGYGLDVLTMLRFDIGIPDKASFLAAFSGAISIGLIIVDDSPRPPSQDFGPSYKYYKSRDYNGVDLKKQRKDMKELKQFEKLKKKFAPGGAHDI